MQIHIHIQKGETKMEESRHTLIKNRICDRVIIVAMLILLAVSVYRIARPGYMKVGAASEDGYYMTYKSYMSGEDLQSRPDWNTIADEIGKLVDGGVALYKQGADAKNKAGYTAYECISRAYGSWYETSGFERTTLGSIGSARVTAVELQFSNCKSAFKLELNEENVAKIQAETQKLKDMLKEDAAILSPAGGGSTVGAWGTFIAVFGILLREGLEAILIVGAIVAYLVKTGNKNKAWVIYVGSLIAIGASFLLAWLLSLLNLTGIPQEIIEGVTALIAVCVLVYVANWMFSKAESESWNNYIKGKVSSSVDNGKTFALGATAFLAVFREGAEVVLFCQQYINDAKEGLIEGGMGVIWGGIGVGFIAIAIVFVLIRVFSVKLPLKPFFMVTSIFMAVMSVAFIGGGFKELIEGEVFIIPTIAGLEWMLNSEVLTFLGIYPTYLTLGAQLALTVFWVVTFIIQVKKNKRKKVTEQA